MKLFGLNNNLKIVEKIVVKENIKYFDNYFNLDNQLEILNYLKTINTNFLLSPITAKIENNKLISSYPLIENCQTFAQLKLNFNLVENVSDLIDKLHKIPIHDNLYKWDYILMLEKYKSQIKTWIDQDLIAEFEFIKQIGEYFNNKNQLVFSHNDLVPGNFLVKDQQMILIDYDYACLNYYLFDYASFISETISGNQNLEKHFINYSLKKGFLLKEDLSDLNKMLIYQDYLWMLWANALYDNCQKKIFWEICQEKIDMYKRRKQYEY